MVSKLDKIQIKKKKVGEYRVRDKKTGWFLTQDLGKQELTNLLRSGTSQRQFFFSNSPYTGSGE